MLAGPAAAKVAISAIVAVDADEQRRDRGDTYMRYGLRVHVRAHEPDGRELTIEAEAITRYRALKQLHTAAMDRGLGRELAHLFPSVGLGDFLRSRRRTAERRAPALQAWLNSLLAHHAGRLLAEVYLPFSLRARTTEVVPPTPERDAQLAGLLSEQMRALRGGARDASLASSPHDGRPLSYTAPLSPASPGANPWGEEQEPVPTNNNTWGAESNPWADTAVSPNPWGESAAVTPPRPSRAVDIMDSPAVGTPPQPPPVRA